MRIDVLTIFPDYLAPLRLSLLGKAVEDGILEVHVHDLRDWTSDRHRTVDDTPYGGGAGMLMRPEPWGAAFDEVLAARTDVPAHVVVPTPAGTPFNQSLAHELAGQPWLVFACGRYEGIDQRVLDDVAERARLTEVSIGDVVLAGGEVAVLAIVEAVGRLLPGVLGNARSLDDESHAAGMLEAPAFTKPPTWRGRAVPDVLLSGHHGQIERWRRDQALRRTSDRRPDLLTALDPRALDSRDLAVLEEEGWVVDDQPGDQPRLVRASGPVAD